MAVPTPTYTDGDWGYDTYTEDGTTYARIVSYSGTGGSGVTITIPGTVGGYVVKEIGKGGSQEGIFDNNTISVNTILGPFPDTITAFNDYSFYSSIKVKIDMSMGLPANLTKIGAYAFYGAQTCYGDLVIPAGVTTIGSYAFQSGGYTSIQLPAGIQSIGAGAFTYCTSVTVVRFLSSSAPSLGSECFGLNLPVPPSAPAKTYLVQSVGNWARTVLNSYGNSKTQFTYEALPMYEHLTFGGNKIQVDSAIRDANGVRIDTNYQRKPTVYERTTNSSTSTTCTLIQFNASDYKANGYLAHFRFRVRSVLQDSYPSDNEFIINYANRTATIVVLNNKNSTSYDIVQNIYAYYPSSASYIDTGNYFIAFRTGRASTNFKIEMIEADVPYTVPATMSASTTTNTSYQSLTPGDYNNANNSYPLMWTGIAVGRVNGNVSQINYVSPDNQGNFSIQSDDFEVSQITNGIAINRSSSNNPHITDPNDLFPGDLVAGYYLQYGNGDFTPFLIYFDGSYVSGFGYSSGYGNVMPIFIDFYNEGIYAIDGYKINRL